MIARQPYLPRFMAGGPGNPLGARAMYLGGTLYRIHGTNDPSSIGKHVSSGCIRLLNEDVIDLYDRDAMGTKVVVLPDKYHRPLVSAEPDPSASDIETAEAPYYGPSARSRSVARDSRRRAAVSAAAPDWQASNGRPHQASAAVQNRADRNRAATFALAQRNQLGVDDVPAAAHGGSTDAAGAAHPGRSLGHPGCQQSYGHYQRRKSCFDHSTPPLTRPART